MEPVTLTIGIAMAVVSVAKAAKEKSAERQQAYADEINKAAQNITDADLSLEETKKRAMQLAAAKFAVGVGEQRRKEAEQRVKKEQQKQLLIAGAIGAAAIGIIVYSIKQ
jgi:hypothetical protein